MNTLGESSRPLGRAKRSFFNRAIVRRTRARLFSETIVDIDDFFYELPSERIAQTPLSRRDDSRLMLLDRSKGSIAHHVFRDLPDLLEPSDLVVVNRSRVIPARVLGRKHTGGAVELLLVRPVEETVWEALVRPGRRLHPGDWVIVSPDLRVRIESDALASDGRRRVRIECGGDVDTALDLWGHVPLPPYIERADGPEDRERYQTIFARDRGSVAAPTAGLHFSEPVLDALRSRGIALTEIVLHVGPGTFQPVKVHDIRQHRVAPETYVIPPETVAAFGAARARGGRIVAVGTTVVRALESAFDDTLDAPRPGEGETELVIFPSYSFRAVDALLTNFHLPRSSLLLLAAAFAGRERILAAYAAACDSGYRFYSYGDAMLIV